MSSAAIWHRWPGGSRPKTVCRGHVGGRALVNSVTTFSALEIVFIGYYFILERDLALYEVVCYLYYSRKDTKYE